MSCGAGTALRHRQAPERHLEMVGALAVHELEVTPDVTWSHCHDVMETLVSDAATSF